MGMIAVDVVVLPDQETAKRAICANAELVRRFGPEIVLDAETCLAHCSLCMGCLDEGDLGAVVAILGDIAAKSSLRELVISGTSVRRGPEGLDVSHYVVEKTAELVELHEAVMKGLSGYLTCDVSAEMVFGDEPPAESTLTWIREYPTGASFENFLPHITLGYGAVEDDPGLPIVSIPVTLAVCHLGNHCTCRKVLAEFAL